MIPVLLALLSALVFILAACGGDDDDDGMPGDPRLHFGAGARIEDMTIASALMVEARSAGAPSPMRIV